MQLVVMARKTRLEIVETIFEFLKKSGKSTFYKSELKKAGIEPSTADEWFKIIEFIQKNYPEIDILKFGKNTLIQIKDDEFLENALKEKEQNNE